MAKFAVGDKVTLPGTVTSVHSDESGDYYEVKVKANNKITNISCEEEDLVEVTTTTETPSETTTEP